MTNIILFSGKAEAGKTTSAKILKTELCDLGYSVAIIPYGQYVKDTARLIFDWDGKKDAAGRKLLQSWGTDVVRKKDPMFWPETVARLVKISEGLLDYVLIDDCRFPNEISVWKDYNYLTVRVNRPGYKSHLTVEQLKHPSETALDDYPFDIYIDNTSTIADLMNEIHVRLTPLVKRLSEKEIK